MLATILGILPLLALASNALGIDEESKFYEGCYEDLGGQRDLSHRMLVAYSRMTPDLCVTACRDAKFNFAGLQNGQDCYCGNRQVRIYEESAGCTSPCSGDAGRVCGGSGVNSIYRVPWDSRYLGCYGSEENGTRVLPQRLWAASEGRTALACVRACGLAGFTYAGLRGGGECSCGDGYGAAGPRNETHCDLRCAGVGWARQNCGGDDLTALYRADTVYGMDQATNTYAVKIKELAESKTTVSLELFSINPSLRTVLTKKLVIDAAEVLTPSDDPACATDCYAPCGDVYYEPGMKYTAGTVILRAFHLDLTQVVAMVPENAESVYVYAQTVVIDANINLPFALQVRTRQLIIDHSKAQYVRVDNDAKDLAQDVEELVQTDVMPDSLFERLSFMCAKILLEDPATGHKFTSWQMLTHLAAYGSSPTPDISANSKALHPFATVVRTYITQLAGIGFQDVNFVPFYTKSHLSSILETYATEISIYNDELTKLKVSTIEADAALELSKDIQTIYLETDLYEAESALNSALDAVTKANETYNRMSLYYDTTLEEVDAASVLFEEGIEKKQKGAWKSFLVGFVGGISKVVTGAVRVAAGDLTGITSISDGSMAIVDSALSVSSMIEQIKHLTKVADELMEKLEEAGTVSELDPFLDDIELTVQLNTNIIEWMNLRNYAITILDDENVKTIGGCKEYKKALLDLCNWGEAMTRAMVERAELLRVATEKKTLLLIKQEQAAAVQELIDGYTPTLQAQEALVNALVEQTYDVRLDLNDALLTFCQAYFYENMKECKSGYRPSFGSSLADLLIKINAARRDALLVGGSPSTVLRDLFISDAGGDTSDCADYKECPINYFRNNRILPINLPTNFSGLSDLKAFKVSEVQVEFVGVKAGATSGNTIMKVKVESSGDFKGVTGSEQLSFMTRPLSVTFEQDIVSGHISIRADIYQPYRNIIQHITPYTTWFLRLSTLTTRDLDISSVTSARLRLIGSAVNAE